jgi:hypothetical protein
LVSDGFGLTFKSLVGSAEGGDGTIGITDFNATVSDATDLSGEGILHLIFIKIEPIAFTLS